MRRLLSILVAIATLGSVLPPGLPPCCPPERSHASESSCCEKLAPAVEPALACHPAPAKTSPLECCVSDAVPSQPSTAAAAAVSLSAPDAAPVSDTIAPALTQGQPWMRSPAKPLRPARPPLYLELQRLLI